MARNLRNKNKKQTVMTEPAEGSRFITTKHLGARIPLPLWQEAYAEASRRKQLGLPLESLQAITAVALSDWLEENKGGE